MLTLRRFWLACALVLAGAAGCGDRAQAASGKPVSSKALTEAQALFAGRCARCHGQLGKGDGPDAAKLSPKPRNFSDPTWQLAVPDRQLERVIVQGGTAVGKSALMPAHPDLAGRPELLAALRHHLRVLATMP